MKRTLLLIPVLAIALLACREKHVTGNNPPPPAPNVTNNGSQTMSGNYPPVEEESNGGDNVSNSGVSSSSSSGTTTTNDSVVTNVVMPGNGSGNTTGPETTPQMTVDSTKLKRLVVSFISKGAGTDHAAHDKLDQWLAKHTDVKYEMVSWGREGEFDYVFDLTDRGAAAQRSVVNDIKTVIGTNDRVLIQEWATPHEARNTGIVPPDYEPAKDTSNTARLVVSFISKGEGIDHDTQKSFEDWLKANYSTVTWETTHWGREGETNYCFRLPGMDARRQEIFVRDVRTFLTDKELVQVNEYAPCDKRKQ